MPMHIHLQARSSFLWAKRLQQQALSTTTFPAVSHYYYHNSRQSLNHTTSLAFRSSSNRTFTTTHRQLRTQLDGQGKQKPKSKMTTTATTLKGQPLDRAALDGMLRRRMFYTPSFEIYGGISGLFDMGPPGAALQSNLIDVWKKHFIRKF